MESRDSGMDLTPVITKVFLRAIALGRGVGHLRDRERRKLEGPWRAFSCAGERC
jgi:hypothetical protein